LTSRGAFGVKAGAHIVCRPQLERFSVGHRYRELISKRQEKRKRVSHPRLRLLDHRVGNGSGARSFANEIKKTNRTFKIPAAKAGASTTTA